MNQAAREELKEIANYKMPFGKYKGKYLIDLPETYLIWFKQKGMPAGKLGRYLTLALELNMNGLTPMVRKIRAHKS